MTAAAGKKGAQRDLPDGSSGRRPNRPTAVDGMSSGVDSSGAATCDCARG